MLLRFCEKLRFVDSWSKSNSSLCRTRRGHANGGPTLSVLRRLDARLRSPDGNFEANSVLVLSGGSRGKEEGGTVCVRARAVRLKRPSGRSVGKHLDGIQKPGRSLRMQRLRGGWEWDSGRQHDGEGGGTGVERRRGGRSWRTARRDARNETTRNEKKLEEKKRGPGVRLFSVV